MIKKMLLALCLIFSAEARAQFAAGYAPVRPEAAPSGEEQQSVLFRQTPARAEAAPRPAEPENIRKPTPYTGSIRILAQVNGDIITTEDINHRVRAFCMTTGIPYNRQTKLLIINKVMQNTIDEKLKAQEAARSQIEIGEKEIDNAVGVFCQNNGISRSRLSQMLKDSGVSPEVFREQLKTDLAWIRVVHRGTMGETITQPEIEEALAIAKRDMSKPKFMLSEIVISAKDAKHISQLAENLRQDPRFELYAAQFSQSPSSSSGGKLGWVTEGQLPPEAYQKPFFRRSQRSDPLQRRLLHFQSREKIRPGQRPDAAAFKRGSEKHAAKPKERTLCRRAHAGTAPAGGY